MREHVIDAAAVNIEGVAQVLHRHGRAFQMPARPAHSKWSTPSWLFFVLWSFPQDEVVRLFLFVFVRVDARTDFQFARVETGQSPVSRETRNAIVDGIPFP